MMDVSSIDTNSRETPWDLLQKYACAIGSRPDSAGEPGSGQEQALLPLIQELTNLSSCASFPGENALRFPLLTELLQRHGCKKGTRLLGKLEKCKCGSKKYNAIVKKLLDLLNRVRWEPVWREIYEKLEECEAVYPGKAEVLCPQGLLESTRSEISQRLAQYGYRGSYPAFRRKKFLPGLHLAESYGVCYWAGMKRNTRFHIHCFESVEDGKLCVRFVTGTALLKKKEQARDIFSCLFRAGGRRFSNQVEYTIPLDAQQPDSALAQCVKAAVKKAALRPLSRKEKKAARQKPRAGFGTFLKEFFLGGGLFALSLVGILALGGCTAMYFVDGLEAAKKLLLQFPWLLFLAGAWVIYGLPAAVTAVTARNK